MRRDIKWNADGSAGNATAKVWPTQADPQRSRPQAAGGVPYAASLGADVARSQHTLDVTRVASTGSPSDASLEGGESPTSHPMAAVATSGVPMLTEKWMQSRSKSSLSPGGS